MAKLSEPSVGLASSLLGEVSFEERLVGVKMTPKTGNTYCSLYRFEEAVKFLYTDSSEDLLKMGSVSSIGYIDVQRLKRWVSEVFGDKELAERMDKEIQNSGSYADRMKVIKELMDERLSQCKDICNGVRSVG